ncbi:MAG TPA: stalk domain-containing protein [Syntrophomonadaceae bacterium]|nr:stalk domain-containing protein [Syntrophomonadaceae bacterium]
MNYRKIIAGFVTVAFLSLSALTPAIADTEVKPIANEVEIVEENLPTSSFESFTGVVQEITPFGTTEGVKSFAVETENGPSNIIISEDTYIVDNAEITVGTQIIVFYDANKPMLMIYPPQYNPEVIAVINDEVIIKVDTFDVDLVSSDNSLQLNLTDETEVVLRDGTPFAGQIADLELVVTYDISTKSIPAQTKPIKIVILHPEKVPADSYVDVDQMDIVAGLKIIKDAPNAYEKDDTVMIPLRAVAEALGYEVIWSQDLVNNIAKVSLDNKAHLTIGDKVYLNESSVELDTAPTLVDNTTYVPLNFFTEVLLLNNAYVFEAQIVIDNEELMH